VVEEAVRMPVVGRRKGISWRVDRAISVATLVRICKKRSCIYYLRNHRQLVAILVGVCGAAPRVRGAACGGAAVGRLTQM
jgi:hypothetical protein